MPVGIKQTTGQSFTSNLTRDQLITMAYKDIGVLSDEGVMSSAQLADGIRKLNMIIREVDATGKWLWAEQMTSVTLVANQFVYTTADGFPENFGQPDRAIYRDGQAMDSTLTIVTSEYYSNIQNKSDQGDPKCVLVNNDELVANRYMTIWPALSSVNTQSVVMGSDTVTPYKCIRSHTASTDNLPTTGANWKIFWVAGGDSPATWAVNTNYTSPQQILLYYRRPLYDFELASDNPDMPSQWTRHLEYRLASDLADLYGIQLQERVMLAEKAKGAYESVFKSSKPQTQDFHNKASYM